MKLNSQQKFLLLPYARPYFSQQSIFYSTGRLRLKLQKIHRVNLVRLNLLKSREIIERHWICPRWNRPGPYKKKYGDAFENDFRARLGVLKKIHSRFIARPLNRFTRVESIQPGFQVLSNGHESIQRTRFNGFKFNRRRPLSSICKKKIQLQKLKDKMAQEKGSGISFEAEFPTL